MKKTENPEVFISYAWGSQEYQWKVLDFAKSLKDDGVKVLIDKWGVVGGHDMYHFMEKSVRDKSVTNVLILLDPVYSKKADNREGGVGTETQIISQEVYESVEQDKFIPIIFERDSDGNVCKPVFLKSRFHYDLSREESYDIEYKKLLKHLYGREIYIEPALGSKPSWIDEEIEISPKKHSAFDSLKENMLPAVRAEKFRNYLRDISDNIVEFGSTTSVPDDPDEYIAAYDTSKTMRAEYLKLIGFHPYIDGAAELIGDFLENTSNRLDELDSYGKDFACTFLHELFIYTVALFVKQKNYAAAGYLLGRTYFITRYEPRGCGYEMFYSYSHHSNLDRAVKAKDGQNYYSGTAAHWMKNIETSFCSKKDFILADEILSNYSIYGNDFEGGHPWFPVTYVYDDEYNSVLKNIACRLSSREKVSQLLVLFNYDYDAIEPFRKKFLEVDQRIHGGDMRNFGYSDAFSIVPLLGRFIKAEDIGTKR